MSPFLSKNILYFTDEQFLPGLHGTIWEKEKRGGVMKHFVGFHEQLKKIINKNLFKQGLRSRLLEVNAWKMC